MHDVPGGELAEPVVELDPLTQGGTSTSIVGAAGPLFRETGCVLTRLRIDLEQRFQERVELEMVGPGDHPEAVAVLESGGGEDELLDLRLLGRSRGSVVPEINASSTSSPTTRGTSRSLIAHLGIGVPYAPELGMAIGTTTAVISLLACTASGLLGNAHTNPPWHTVRPLTKELVGQRSRSARGDHLASRGPACQGAPRGACRAGSVGDDLLESNVRWGGRIRVRGTEPTRSAAMSSGSSR